MSDGDVYLIGPVWPTHPPPAHINFSEWADGRVPQDLHNRTPCPLCGHPTGDCTHHLGGPIVMSSTPSQSKQADNLKKTASGVDPVNKDHAAQNAATVQSVIDTDPGEATGMSVVRVDGTVDKGLYDESDGETYVTLKEPVLEEFFFPDTKRPSYRVLYHKGQVVKKSVVDAYNADTELQNKLRENPGALNPANPADIDSSTLHAGTYPGLSDDARKQAESKVKESGAK